jgi:hypothetical protein
VIGEGVAGFGERFVCRRTDTYDFETGTNFLISRSSTSGSPGNGNSDGPEIRINGRYVAYRSEANDLVPGDDNAAQMFSCGGASLAGRTGKVLPPISLVALLNNFWGSRPGWGPLIPKLMFGPEIEHVVYL